MDALLFIQERRKSAERIDQISTLRLAMKGSKEDVERAMRRWAKDADINLTLED